METKFIKELWGKVNPLLIESYLSQDGYQAFLSCVKGEKKPDEVLEMIKASGLRGRGGAGFPTGDKWQFAKEASKKLKKSPYLIINADESQPGVFKDRYIIENNPHSVLEGALIAAYALGAKKIYIYLNGKYKIQQEILKTAINAVFEKVLKGEAAVGAKGLWEIKLMSGAGGYIYGEETALINSIEGRRGEPRLRPPYPTAKGLFKRPTVVNNLETIVNVGLVVRHGVKKYTKYGIKNSYGTKLFCVTGAVRNPGVYEFPLGTSVREVLKAAGGMAKGKKLDFVAVAGASVFLKSADLDKKLAYEPGRNKVVTGLGDLLVVDKGTSIEDLALSWARFYARESCGQCTPCREGTFQLLKIAERLKNDELLEKDWENLRALMEVMDKTSFCPLGKFAAGVWKEIIKHCRHKFFKK